MKCTNEDILRELESLEIEQQEYNDAVGEIAYEFLRENIAIIKEALIKMIRDSDDNLPFKKMLFEDLHGKPYPEVVPSHLTHIDLVGLGGKYLRYTQNCKIVVQEPVTWHRIRPDIMGFQSTSEFMIEVKVSRSDFFADKKKKHWGETIANYSYYLVPEHLVSIEEVPENYGLLYARGLKLTDIEVIKEPSWIKEGCDDNLKAMILYGIMCKENCVGRFDSKGKIIR